MDKGDINGNLKPSNSREMNWVKGLINIFIVVSGYPYKIKREKRKLRTKIIWTYETKMNKDEREKCENETSNLTSNMEETML